MEPKPNNEANIENFRNEYASGLNEFLDMELFSDSPLPPDPRSMGLEDKDFEELNDDEILVVRETLLGTLDINPQDETSVQRKYLSQAPPEATVPGEINAVVYKTNRPEVYLQELTYQDGKQR